MMKIKLLFFVTKPYSVSIIKPIEDFCITQSNIKMAWFIIGEVEKEDIKSEIIKSTKEVKAFDPDAVIVPGNIVPDFWPGMKVQIFHGLCEEKKGHYDITGFFDLYCTPGSYITEKFEHLQKKYNTFIVRETGWPKLDQLDLSGSIEESKVAVGLDPLEKVILFAPTFSPKYSSSEYLFDSIKNMQYEEYHWLVKFHDLEDRSIVDAYRDLESSKFQIIQDSDILPWMMSSDILITDTSSVAYEYLFLDRPIITFRATDRHEKGLDMMNPDELLGAITRSIIDPSEFSESRKDILSEIHPYSDGKSSQRLIDIISKVIKDKEIQKLKPKPRNWFRKRQIRKIVSQ